MRPSAIDNQLESGGPRRAERHLNVIAAIVETCDFIAEGRFGRGRDRREQKPRRIAAAERHTAAASQRVKNARAEARDARAAVIDDARSST